MKNKWNISNLSVLFLFLTIGVALFSWIASIHGWEGVQSLLSAEGVRWVLGHVVESYVQVPALGIVLIALMGMGVGVRAGLYEALKRRAWQKKMLSRKERRALMMAIMVFVVYGITVLVAVMLPWNFLQSVTGSWLHSPFSKGLVYILSVGLGLSGMAYGYVSDTFHRVSQVVEAMSCLIARQASYFVTLFFIVQFFSVLVYTRLPEWMNISDGVLNEVYQLFCYLPLLNLFTSKK